MSRHHWSREGVQPMSAAPEPFGSPKVPGTIYVDPEGIVYRYRRTDERHDFLDGEVVVVEVYDRLTDFGAGMFTAVTGSDVYRLPEGTVRVWMPDACGEA